MSFYSATCYQYLSRSKGVKVSKFEEICQAYKQANEEISNYLENCGQFTGKLVRGMEDYLQCPHTKISYKTRTGESSSLRESMYIEDGFWRLNVEMILWEDGGVRSWAVSDSGLYYPSQTVLFSVLTKKTTNDSFIVQVLGYDTEFTINKNNQEDFRYFYEFIVDRIKDHYKNMLRYIIEHGRVPERLEGVTET